MRPGAQDASAFSTPAATAQASAGLAASDPKLRWICTSISATFSTGATAQATQITLNLRNSTTGAGTIIWSITVPILPVNGSWSFSISDLSIPGAYGAAMTLEFSAAGAAGTFESCDITAYQSA